MATQTKPRAERGRPARQGLEAQGLRPRGELHWNAMAAELVQAAVRRGEGELADMGPFVAVTSPHTGRSPNDKFIVRRADDGAGCVVGQGQRRVRPGEVRAACWPTCSGISTTQPELFIQDLYAGADAAHRVRVRFVTPTRVALAVRAQHVHPPRPARPAHVRGGLQRAPGAGVPGRSREARHAHRHVHHPEPREAHRPHRRHAVRGRAEEVDLHGDELPPPEARRAVDALLRQHRREGRHGAVLRPLRHREDDALGRPRPLAHRRRRARLVIGRRVQLRGRMLREGDPPLRGRRAGHLPDDADVRDDPRERRPRAAYATRATSATSRSPRTRARRTPCTTSGTSCRRAAARIRGTWSS